MRKCMHTNFNKPSPRFTLYSIGLARMRSINVFVLIFINNNYSVTLLL